MDDRSKYVKVGRPKGTIKDPNRLKIMNPNGRKIDVDGVQYNKYIRQGYITNGTRLILPENAIPKVSKVGRPKGCKNKIETDKIINTKFHKVENPDTKRMIKTDNVTFKRLSKKYYYNPDKNEFIKNDGEVKNTFTFTPKLMTINSKYEVSNARHVMNNHINGMIDRYTNQGSGWVINRIMRHFISVNRYIPLAAKSYIKLPPIIQNKKATINIQNEDNKCFMYCLGRALDPNPEKGKLERVSKHLKNVCTELGLDKIKMPVSLKNIPKIEKALNLDINIFGFIRGDIHLLSHVKETPGKKMVNLSQTPLIY